MGGCSIAHAAVALRPASIFLIQMVISSEIQARACFEIAMFFGNQPSRMPL